MCSHAELESAKNANAALRSAQQRGGGVCQRFRCGTPNLGSRFSILGFFSLFLKLSKIQFVSFTVYLFEKQNSKIKNKNKVIGGKFFCVSQILVKCN